VLAIHFDWEAQARAIVEGIRWTIEDRVLLWIRSPRDRIVRRAGLLTEHVPLKGGRSGFYTDGSGLQVAFHLTPGLRDHKGLGWFGVITPLERMTFLRIFIPLYLFV